MKLTRCFSTSSPRNIYQNSESRHEQSVESGGKGKPQEGQTGGIFDIVKKVFKNASETLTKAETLAKFDTRPNFQIVPMPDGKPRVESRQWRNAAIKALESHVQPGIDYAGSTEETSKAVALIKGKIADLVRLNEIESQLGSIAESHKRATGADRAERIREDTPKKDALRAERAKLIATVKKWVQ